MKPLKAFLADIASLLAEGNRSAALDKATDALQIYPNSKKLQEYVSTL